jgi:hypothetical protein
MTAKELNRIFQKGECLSLDTMRLYIDGKLHPKSVHEVEKHLIECTLCSAAMDGLTPRRMKEVNKLSQHIEKRLAVYMNTPPPVPFFRRFAFPIGAGILLIGGAITWWAISSSNSAAIPEHDTATISGGKEQTLIQRPSGNILSSNTDRPQDNGAVVAYNPATDNHNSSLSSKTQDLPASVPGQTNTLTVTEEHTTSTTNLSSPSNPSNETQPPASNTRTASSVQPLRVKSVTVYPPVTHSSKKSRKETEAGQLGRSSGSDAAFQLDEMPTYPGGDEALKAYIASSFKPVNLDRSQAARLSTGVLFIVNAKTGEISSPELSFSIAPAVDAELLRVINAMPSWNPGKKRGEVEVMLGITFE